MLGMNECMMITQVAGMRWPVSTGRQAIRGSRPMVLDPLGGGIHVYWWVDLIPQVR